MFSMPVHKCVGFSVGEEEGTTVDAAVGLTVPPDDVKSTVPLLPTAIPVDSFIKATARRSDMVWLI